MYDVRDLSSVLYRIGPFGRIRMCLKRQGEHVLSINPAMDGSEPYESGDYVRARNTRLTTFLDSTRTRSRRARRTEASLASRRAGVSATSDMITFG